MIPSKISPVLLHNPVETQSNKPDETEGKKRTRDEEFRDLTKELFDAITQVYQPAGIAVTNACRTGK